MLNRMKKESGSASSQILRFDGDNESTLMVFAQFLSTDLVRFYQSKNCEFNSHMPLRQSCANMVKLFEPNFTHLVGGEITADKIIGLVNRK